MPKLLPKDDFRARRRILVRNDFGLAPNRVPRPSDVIEKATWNGIVTLPDDVAVRTSNYHGTTIKQLDDFWGAWVDCYGEVQDCIFPVMLDAGDDFQAATYTALTGFYRLSVAALRSALELTAIGAWAQVCGKQKEFRSWRAGKSPILVRPGLRRALWRDDAFAGAFAGNRERQPIRSETSHGRRRFRQKGIQWHFGVLAFTSRTRR